MSGKIQRREFLKCLLTSGIALSGTGGLGTLLIGCTRGEEVSVGQTYSFLAHLPEALISAPQKEYVRESRFTISGEERDVLYEHPDSLVTFKDVPVYKAARLEFGIGINEAAWDKSGDGVLFEIFLNDDQGEEHAIYSRYIDPKKNRDDRKWIDEQLDIKNFEGREVSFTFKTSAGPKGNNTSDWAGWSTPEVNASKVVRLKKKRPPNVILISIDTLRPDYLGCYGYPKNISPNIDRLAKESALFKHAIAQSPWTLPSHMSILTSLYPQVHLTNDPTSKLEEGRNTLSEILKGEGYRTAAFVDGGYLRHKFGYDQGFDTYDDKGGRIAKINDKVIEFIEDHFQEKFFLFMHVYDVHGPYEPPSPYDEMYYTAREEKPDASMNFVREIGYHEYQKFDSIKSIRQVKARYAGCVNYVDNVLGKLFRKLTDLKIWDNTLIVFLSDHGESIFEHHVYIGHGLFIYDNEVKIPLIIKPPKGDPNNLIVESQVESIDVMPTVLDILDFSQSKEGQGKSLAGFIKNKRPDNENSFAFGESSNTGGTNFVRTNRWKYISRMKRDFNEIAKHLKPSEKVDLTKFIVEGEQLYDLQNDPMEQKNLITKEAGVAEELRAGLQEWEETNLKIRKKLDEEGDTSLKKMEKLRLTDQEKEQLRALGYLQ